MDIRGEVSGADFGDRRLERRLVRLAELFARGPDLSFPKATGDDAALEATYRFLNNSAVTPAAMLAPHFTASTERCAEAGVVVVCHDTTEFRFSTPREGLGRISSADHGFLGHFALAVHAGSRAPLGVVGLQTLFRDTPPPKSRHSERRPIAERESRRWTELVHEVEARLGRRAQAVHVMDREADAFELLADLIEKQRRFVIRLQFDRVVETEEGRVRVTEALAGVQAVFEREVHLSQRRAGPRDPPSRAKKHPLRNARVARLAASARRVELVRPSHVRGEVPLTLTLNVVQVSEIDAPENVVPVEWRLVTSEPIATTDDIAGVVDAYRMRWVVEEYFKALKTGCGYERRQLETRAALLNALALFVPIAWQLLALRTLARDASETPAATLLSALKLRVLQGHKRTKLHPGATVREAMLAIAALGGHIKNNGDPGWIVLGRGFEDLLLLEQGAAIALGCDQS